MRYGIREIVDVCFRAKHGMTLGGKTYYKQDPVLYFESLKTSSLEGAATTVYAQGGKGNPRLIGWDGEKTLTLTFEDALISPESFSVLSGAELGEASTSEAAYIHNYGLFEATGTSNTDAIIDLKEIPYIGSASEGIEIFIMETTNGQISGAPMLGARASESSTDTTVKLASGNLTVGNVYMVDYYQQKTTGVTTLTITPDKFADSFYIEGSTLWREENTGADYPAEIIIPNGKVQSNFTLTMASSGDPSTFTFTVDCMPDYTKWNKTKKVMAILQIDNNEMQFGGEKINTDYNKTRREANPS